MPEEELTSFYFISHVGNESGSSVHFIIKATEDKVTHGLDGQRQAMPSMTSEREGQGVKLVRLVVIVLLAMVVGGKKLSAPLLKIKILPTWQP